VIIDSFPVQSVMWPLYRRHVYLMTSEMLTPVSGLKWLGLELILDFGLFCNFETLKGLTCKNKKDLKAKTWTKKDLFAIFGPLGTKT
jgi:hypothetical protein